MKVYMATRFFQKLGDISSALQFLVMSGCQEDAFQMAEVFSLTFRSMACKYYFYVYVFRSQITWMSTQR